MYFTSWCFLFYGSPEGTSNFIFDCFSKTSKNTWKKMSFVFFFENQVKRLFFNFFFFLHNQVKMLFVLPPFRKWRSPLYFKRDVVISLVIKILLSMNLIIMYTHGWFRYVVKIIFLNSDCCFCWLMFLKLFNVLFIICSVFG